MVSIATTGAALVRSASEEGSGPSKDWEVATSALPGFMKVLTLENYGEHQCSGLSQSFSDIELSICHLIRSVQMRILRKEICKEAHMWFQE